MIVNRSSFIVTSNSLLLQTLQREQETYEKMSLWTSDKVIKHFSTSIITGATADALALDENIAWVWTRMFQRMN